MKNKNYIIIALLLIVVGGVSFFAGTKYQQSKQPTFSRQNGGAIGLRNGTGQNIGNRQGFRPVNGEIIASDTKSITVKMTDGTSRIVILSGKTTINKASEGTIADLKVGEKVTVFGQDNTNGSVTAQNIQLNPINRAVPTP
jgi:hypothetical protein